MKISLITDEISADPETAIELGVEWGIRDYEIRGFGTERVPLFSPYQKDRLKELLDEYDVRIIAISPGLFKIPVPRRGRARFPVRSMDMQLYTRWRDARDLLKFQRDELLPLSLEYAKEIGAGKIIIFSFQREGELIDRTPDEVPEVLRQAAELTGNEGLELAIEVEQGYWADTGARTAELVKTVNQPSLGVNWDPANAFDAGDTPFPDGYRAVRQFVRHVHFKDIQRNPQGRPVYAVEGQIDWSGQIKALARDGYQGYISVETHLQPKVSSARRMTSRLQELIAAANL